MQNKYISLKVMMAALLITTGAMAQEAELVEAKEVPATEEDAMVADFSASISQKETVPFPARTSMDSMELAPLPGIYETDMKGPQPMEESVSVNDMPSEKLLGRLTPEIFREMAEMEREAAYLKLKTDRERWKADLENARAQYRQARLDEIQKREEVIRSRIQWWQEQEKLRLEMEKERQEAEDVKNKMAEAEALKAQQEAEAAAAAVPEEMEELFEDEELPVQAATSYVLMNVKGTRGNLVARVKNTETGEITSVKVGESLNGEVVTAITAENVVIDRNGTEYFIKFSN